MRNKTLWIILACIFTVQGMEIKSLFLQEKYCYEQNEYPEYPDRLLDAVLCCESREDCYREDFTFKDGGNYILQCYSAEPPKTLISSTGRRFRGTFHIDAKEMENEILHQTLVWKKPYDKKYKPEQKFHDNRWFWNRYGNYTAVALGCLIGYNLWSYLKSSK